MTILRLIGVSKAYPGAPPVQVLDGVSLTLEAGERLAIIGRSGAGKSTLLNILGRLDEPTAGSYELLGRSTETLKPRRRDALRGNSFGFVFQDSHVLGHRTVWQNMELRLALAGVPRGDRDSLIAESLTRVGLEHRAHSLARLLSGGEKQRLAIARAVCAAPSIILADEPTGNLDAENARSVLGLFDQQAARGVGVIVITHDMRLVSWADRALNLTHGRLERVVAA